jgi:hypothetical protein
MPSRPLAELRPDRLNMAVSDLFSDLIVGCLTFIAVFLRRTTSFARF